MRGVIVIEGADAAGKTTLANYICNKFNAKYEHMIYYKDCWTNHLACVRRVIELAENNVVVVDRHWISEVLYAHVFRDGSQYPLAARFMDRMFVKMGALYILCVPSDITKQIARHAERKEIEMYDSIEKIVKIYKDFSVGNNSFNYDKKMNYGLSFIKNGGFLKRNDAIKYDMNYQQPNDLDNIISFSLKNYEINANLRSLSSANIIGNVFDPKVIFVGDKVSNKHPNNIPPWPWGGKCGIISASKILYEAVQELNVDETKVAFCNANVNEDYGPSLNTIVRFFPSARFIALGKVATNKLKYCSNHLNMISVKHPQWVRRFDNKTPFSKYIEQAIPHNVKF